MEIITGYTGTPHITAEQDRETNAGICGSGSYILPTGNQLAAELVTNNEIRIKDGILMHQGCAAAIKANTYDTLTIMNGSQGLKRQDLVVARYTKTASSGVEEIELLVIQGTAAESPADPAYNTGSIRNGDTPVDMPLYRITLNGLNVTAIDAVCSNLASLADVQDRLTKTPNRLINGTNYAEGAKEWTLENRSVYLFTVAGVNEGAVEDNLAAAYIVHTGETAQKKALVKTLYKGNDSTGITVSGGKLTYSGVYRYCEFSLTKL